MQLPQEFIEYTSALFGEERWNNYLASFDAEPPVSIRLNPFKISQQQAHLDLQQAPQPPKGEFFDSNEALKEEIFPEISKTPVPWCRNAWYLSERPNFTHDPLLHAGCYYVQEAGSMFLDEVLRQLASPSACTYSDVLNIGLRREGTANARMESQSCENAINESAPLAHREGTANARMESQSCENAINESAPLAHREGTANACMESQSCENAINESAPSLRGRAGGEAALDLCAAPGGKSTLLRAALPDTALLYSNEPDRRRANILMENIQKQGHPRVVVTNNYAIDYQKAGLRFDLILTDVPCSGEGMFRKDHGAIGEWSLQNVMKCAALQRSIIEDIWPCLNRGGILIYSTCTFNLHEDEENVRWICDTLGAELIPIETKAEWNITGSLLPDWHEPVYRFIPGTTRGEGLFMAVLRKTTGEDNQEATPRKEKKKDKKKGNKKGNKEEMPPFHILHDPSGVYTLPHREGWGGSSLPHREGKGGSPLHSESLLITLPKDKYPMSEVDRDTALRYLHHEAITLGADTPRGYVIVTYQGHPLGFVKNIGNRANNLYPQEWKIRNL